MEDILAFIPQRPPFVMVDEIVAVDEQGGSTRYKIPGDNLFVQNGILTEPALIENIAQTAAARVGYICQQKNETVPVGFIGAVQQLQVHALPRVGDTIETHIEIKNQVFDVTLIAGTIKLGQETLATCNMKIFLQSK